MVGVTYAWFTYGTDIITNYFTVGTLSINTQQIKPSNTVTETELSLAECTELEYEITSTGSKSAYVRARFDGFWKNTSHTNKASVSALYNGEEFSASDYAHFNYGDYTPDFVPINGSTQVMVGFTYETNLSPLEFSPLRVNDDIVLSYFDSTGVMNQSNKLQEGFTLLSTEPCGPKVEPTIESGTGPGQNPTAEELRNIFRNAPYNYEIECDLDDLTVSKFDITPNDMPLDGDGEYNDGDGTLNITITKKEINGRTVFKFETNIEVIAVFAKGGSNGGHLYGYAPIVGPVKEDCGLTQPPTGQPLGSGWSHITFYYCEPQDDPGIDFAKLVSVDGGNTWYGPNISDTITSTEYDYDDSDTWPKIAPDKHDAPDFYPIFKFIVKNTGNVMLEDVIVYDQYFEVQYGPISLLAGEERTFTYAYEGWKDSSNLSTENITIKLADTSGNWNPNDWEPAERKLREYFYYTKKLPANSSPGSIIPFHIQICLDDEKTDYNYDGAIFTLYAYFEAVQTSHPENMVEGNWPVVIDNDGNLSLID